MIIDQDLKPWLLEVNASPSLSANTKEDYMMKTEMLHGMLDVVDMEVRSTNWKLEMNILLKGFIKIDSKFCHYGPFYCILSFIHYYNVLVKQCNSRCHPNG